MAQNVTQGLEEWVASRLKSTGQTPFEFFRDCWHKINPNRNPDIGSKRFIKDANLYNGPNKTIPYYVRDFWEKNVRKFVFPFRIV